MKPLVSTVLGVAGLMLVIVSGRLAGVMYRFQKRGHRFFLPFLFFKAQISETRAASIYRAVVIAAGTILMLIAYAYSFGPIVI